MKNIHFIARKTGRTVPENPPGEAMLKFLYSNPFGKLPLEALVRRKMLSNFYGKLMDRPSSRKRIAPFVQRFRIDMTEAVVPQGGFRSFSEFFFRKLRPEARPIGEGFVSPADGKLLAFEDVGELCSFFVKGERFTLPDFLRDPALAEAYKGGSMVIVRLAPNDYHRYHFPYAGRASAPTRIEGRYYSVSPYALAKDFAKVFCQNKREFTRLETADKGTLLVCPVGATMVGSIISTYPEGQQVEKGQEMGYFAFGGSTLVVLLPPGAVRLDPDLLENTRQRRETFVRMGERIGL